MCKSENNPYFAGCRLLEEGICDDIRKCYDAGIYNGEISYQRLNPNYRDSFDDLDADFYCPHPDAEAKRSEARRLINSPNSYKQSEDKSNSSS